MALESNQDSSATGSECKLLDLHWELREAIWTALVEEDLLIVKDLYAPPGRPWPQYLSTFGSLTTSSLLRVNKQVKDEITVVYSGRNIFSFQSCLTLNLLIKDMCYYRGRPARRRSQTCMFLKVGHLSVLPQRTVHIRKFTGGLGWKRNLLHCSRARPDGWYNFDSEMAQLLYIIRTIRMELRILEIPAVSLLHITIVRQLRRLRGVTLHLVLVSESTTLERLTLHEGTKSHQKQIWLGETGDTDIVLPIYETPQKIEPFALAPLSSFAAAIRREVASTTQPPLSVTQVQKDPPFWIEFDSEHMIATNGLSPPSSGWYRYSARDPGVCCLEKTSEPTPPVPRTRNQLKRCRREGGRLLPSVGPFGDESALGRTQMVDLPRAREIKKMGIQGVVVKHEVGGLRKAWVV